MDVEQTTDSLPATETHIPVLSYIFMVPGRFSVNNSRQSNVEKWKRKKVI